MFLHGVAYDFYGRRLATCGTDQSITVWSAGSDGGWSASAAWVAHTAPVYAVAWAHPSFGCVLASASADHTVLIWEEVNAATSSGNGSSSGSSWRQRAVLGDARGAVRTVAFAPRHLGLRLAAGSADGSVRVYEAADAAASLAHWSLDSFEAEAAAGGGVAALAWAPGPTDAPLLAVGGGSGAAAVRTRSIFDSAGIQAVFSHNLCHKRPLFFPFHPCSQVWGWTPAARRWLPMISLAGHVRVLDVAWAPSVGRPCHLIASCGSEGAVAVWKVWTAREETTSPDQAAATAADDDSMGDGQRPWGARRLAAAGAASASMAATFSDQAAGPVWRVEWNILGTVLAAAGDDGMLRIRRQAVGGGWELAGEIPLTGPDDIAAVRHKS